MLPLKNGQIRAIRFNGRDAPEVFGFLIRNRIRTGLPGLEAHSRECPDPNDVVVRMAIVNGFHPDKLSPKGKREWGALPLVEEHVPLRLDK